MGVRTLSASLLVLASAAVEAPAQNHVLRFNNPTAQGGMYNAQSGPIRFNSPTNQVGMYGSDPVLRFNNPTSQVGMYGSAPALRFNNPLTQGNSVPAGFNNPLTQGGSVPAGFNNPLTQGGSVPTGFNNPLTQGNFIPGGFNNPLVGGWGAYGYNNPLTQAGMYTGMGGYNALTPNNLMPQNLNTTGRGLNSTPPRVNPQASATLNGLNGTGARKARSTAAPRKGPKRRR